MITRGTLGFISPLKHWGQLADSLKKNIHDQLFSTLNILACCSSKELFRHLVNCYLSPYNYD